MAQEHQEDQWAAQRREAAVERARMLRARQDAEHARAERIARAFITVALREGLPPAPLLARGYKGGTAGTGLRGWYLRSDQTVALGADGAFYVLTMPLGWRERIAGVKPTPARVPLTVGEGGRDGDVVPLLDALERLLPGWRDRCEEPLV
ncbi:Uncharacterised protein [Actinomyces bovis]|uniref:YdhG-like domain-containing protein n=1 Tax=Actinomyces bovis TaxID=1658 RepID=A0ABY1VMZ2_9ACTO|nr:hypothetical protein [Actinomyces bovis]SPT53425.1 Uncharacterised protein [Actinomyces bovis]VEG52874.1 Uncharacterised protein [Actinomyces israelii]